MATFLQLKNWFARYIGENDATSLESVAGDLINDSLKELSSLHPFKCNWKSASVVVSSGVGTLPTNLDYSHIGQIQVYRYSSTTKYDYKRVDFDDFSKYDTSEYVYAIDPENNYIKLPDDVTITIDYYAVPTDLSANDSTTDISIPKAISRMAAAQYWQSFEEDEAQAKLNFQMADNLINQNIVNNKMAVPYRKARPYGNRDLGHNKWGYNR